MNMIPDSDWISVPFFTKVYGGTVKRITGPKQGLYNPAGTKMLDIQSGWDQVHYRFGYSVNRRRPLTGSSTPWIPPSSYDRYADLWILSGSGKVKSLYKTALGWYIEGTLNPENVSTYYGLSHASLQNPHYVGLGRAFRFDGGDYLNARNRAKTEALVDLASSKADLAVDLAQAVKTADLFFDTGKVVIDFALALKKGKIAKAFRHLNPKQVKKLAKEGKLPDKLANQWLAFHYGWRPLAMTAYGLLELLKEQLEPALLVHGRGQGRMSWNGTLQTKAVHSGFLPPAVITEQSKASMRCGLTGRLTSLEYLRTLNRVGLVNPASLVWELIPFSFVVDWVMPIGDVAYGLSASAGLSFVGGHEVCRYQRIANVDVDPEYTMTGVPPSAEYRVSGFKRTALGSFPRPVPYLKSPFLGSSRIATILALLTKLRG